MSKSGCFCVDNNKKTDYFTPCAFVRVNKKLGYSSLYIDSQLAYADMTS